MTTGIVIISLCYAWLIALERAYNRAEAECEARLAARQQRQR